MNRKKILGFTSIQVFLIFSYFVCWVSISTSFSDLFYVYNEIRYLGNKIINLNDIINFLRQLLNTLIFPILIGIVILNIKKINFKKDILFILPFFYFLMQIPGLYFSNNSLMNFVFVMSAFNILLIFVIANIYFDKKRYSIFAIITLLMLITISVLNYKTLVNFVSNESASSLYTFFTSSETFLGKNSPRSTGSSRTFLLIFIISIVIFHKFFERHNHLKIIFYNIIATLILLFQSRTTLFLLIIFIIINFIFEKKFSIYNFFKHLIFYVLFPIIILYSTLYLKNIIHTNFYSNTNNLSKDLQNNELSNLKKFLLLNKNFQRPVDPDTFSSGRVHDWNSIIKKIDESMLYGYGSQGDRYLINQTASNGLIYAISSSGIIGLVFFILFSLYFLFIILRNFTSKNISDLKQNNLCSLLVLLILMRSILESSYAVFGIDFIVIFTFINFLNKLNAKTK